MILPELFRANMTVSTANGGVDLFEDHEILGSWHSETDSHHVNHTVMPMDLIVYDDEFACPEVHRHVQ